MMAKDKEEPFQSIDKREKLDYYNKIIVGTTSELFSGLGYEVLGNTIFNKAYFSSKEDISRESLDKKVDLATKKIDALHEIMEQVQEEVLLNSAQKNMIKARIEKAILALQYHQHALYIEAEKTGFELGGETIAQKNAAKKEIEEKLYGKSLLDRPERLKKVGEKLHALTDHNKALFELSELQFWEEKVLSHFDPLQGNTERVEEESEHPVFISEESIFPLVEIVLQLQGFKKSDLVKIQISEDENQQDAMQVQDLYFIPHAWKEKELYRYFEEQGLGEKFKIIKQITGTNSVDINKGKQYHLKLAAPVNGKYDLKKSVLPVIFDHEIATHVKTGKANIDNLNLKDANRSDLEEAIAIMNERVGQGKTLDAIYEASVGDITQFLGETLDDEELSQAIALYYRLSKDTGNREDRVRRVRIGVPIGEKGTRKKDLVYGTSKEILKDLEQLSQTEEGIELLNKYARIIYSTKLGYDSLQDIENILEGIVELKDLEPQFPLFIGKILYWKLFKGKLDRDEMMKEDIRSVIKDYPEASYAQKRLLIQIKQLIEEDQEYQASRSGDELV